MKNLLFVLDGREELAKSIIDETNIRSKNNYIELGVIRNQKFSDGEVCVDFLTSVRGKRVYILSSPNSSDEIIKLMLAINAAKLDGANSIILILPTFPYSRGDKKDYSRGPISAKVISSMIQNAGTTSIITFDLHADQTQGFLDIPVIHIEGKNVFDEYIFSILTPDTILCSPDAGSGKRVKRMRDQLQKKYNVNLNYIMLDKTRKEANVIDEMIIIGDVKDKDVIILDDMVDTFGTANKGIDVLLENGAKSVKMIASHGILSGPAYDRINNSKLNELIISDSLPHNPNNKIKVITVSKQIGMAIASINDGVSYEDLKNNNN